MWSSGDGELSGFLRWLAVKDPHRAELAQELDRRMLELWAVAESRRSAADPRWHAFNDRKTAPQPDELQQWAAGTWPERWAVALEPRTPRELLERLAHDPVDFIARLCQKRLATAVSPLPEPVELMMNQTGEPAMDVGEGDWPWVEALQRLQRRVQAGEVAMEEAVRFVEALGGSWVSSALGEVMEHEEAPRNLKEIPETLVRYAHLLPEYLSDLDSQYDGASIFQGQVTESGILTPLPVHPHFTDEELLERLSFAGRPGIGESDWCRMAFDPRSTSRTATWATPAPSPAGPCGTCGPADTCPARWCSCWRLPLPRGGSGLRRLVGARGRLAGVLCLAYKSRAPSVAGFNLRFQSRVTNKEGHGFGQGFGVTLDKTTTLEGLGWVELRPLSQGE